MKNKKLYSENDILKAAKAGEVSMIDAKYIVTILKEKYTKANIKTCETCRYFFTNPFDQQFCILRNDIENNETCNNRYYIKTKTL